MDELRALLVCAREHPLEQARAEAACAWLGQMGRPVEAEAAAELAADVSPETAAAVCALWGRDVHGRIRVRAMALTACSDLVEIWGVGPRAPRARHSPRGAKLG